MSEKSPAKPWPSGLKALIALVALGATLYVALSLRASVARCPPGLNPQASRCCPDGQGFDAGRKACVGAARACAATQVLSAGACVVLPRRIAFSGGELRLSPSDWEAQGKLTARLVSVGAFDLDQTEVTLGAFHGCADGPDCRGLATRELGLPVTSVTPLEAQAFCEQRGGRLPTSDEWLFAASGEQGRRFPWGQTGLVCRRAVFGTESGPCASGSAGPDLVGSRPDGATPEGLLDMAGNVAEFTRGPSGIEVRGGSFRSQVAATLKVWHAERVDSESATQSPAFGFRCAYDSRR